MSQPQQQQRGLNEVLADIQWWQSWSPKHWVVTGLTERCSATLLKLVDDKEDGYVSLSSEHVRFIQEILAEKERELNLLEGALQFEKERADGLADELAEYKLMCEGC